MDAPTPARIAQAPDAARATAISDGFTTDELTRMLVDLAQAAAVTARAALAVEALVRHPADLTLVPAPITAAAIEAPAEPAAPYGKTLGLLQVVTWSILVAAVLVVALAWFG